MMQGYESTYFSNSELIRKILHNYGPLSEYLFPYDPVG